MSTPLFRLSDGTEVFEGDILYHPDIRRVGWACKAEFEPTGEMVTVRSPNGAVPTVAISELRREPPLVPKRCSQCGRIFDD